MLCCGGCLWFASGALDSAAQSEKPPSSRAARRGAGVVWGRIYAEQATHHARALHHCTRPFCPTGPRAQPRVRAICGGGSVVVDSQYTQELVLQACGEVTLIKLWRECHPMLKRTGGIAPLMRGVSPQALASARLLAKRLLISQTSAPHYSILSLATTCVMREPRMKGHLHPETHVQLGFAHGRTHTHVGTRPHRKARGVAIFL